MFSVGAFHGNSMNFSIAISQRPGCCFRWLEALFAVQILVRRSSIAFLPSNFPKRGFTSRLHATTHAEDSHAEQDQHAFGLVHYTSTAQGHRPTALRIA